MPDVSVILPTHNRAHVLLRAIDSVLTQTDVSSELIVVDDGSSDGTPELLSRTATRGAFEVLRTLNRGVSAARNLGIACSSGDLIALLDSDDEWLPDKLASQVRFMSQHPEIPLVQTDEIWMRHGRRVNPHKKHAKSDGDLFERSLELCLISPSAVMMRRSLLENVGGFDESLAACEDYDLWLRVTARHRVGLIRQPFVVRYGGSEDQLSARFWGMDRFRITSLCKLLQSNLLNDTQRAATVKVLAKKSQILIQGARRRNKEAIASRFETLVARFLCVLLVVLAASAFGACAQPDSEFDALLDEPSMAAISDDLKGSKSVIADYSEQNLLGEQDRARLSALLVRCNLMGYHLRIVAVSVTHNFNLGQFVDVIRATSDIGHDEVLVVITQVGLHAYVTFMSYAEIRKYSREANVKLESGPAPAVEHLTHQILVHARRHERLRRNMSLLAAGCALLLAFASLLARPSRKTVTPTGGGQDTPTPDRRI